MKNKFFKHSYLGSSMNKKGMEMAINTIVTMVLALMILLFMFLFFTDAGGEFVGKIKGHSSYSNVDAIIDKCNFHVESDAKYSYCCEKWDVRYLDEGLEEKGEFNCLEVGNRFGRVDGLNCGGIKC